jgi:hypothetical protein
MKVERKLFKLLYHSLITFILIRIVLFFIPDSLIVHYLGANPCWYNFETSAFAGSIIQIPGLLLHPLACTLAKQGITHAVIEVFIAAMIMVGIIALLLENKHFSQKSAIEKNVSNSRLMRDIIETHVPIKWEQNDKKNFVSIEDDVLPEVFRISGGSRFCWIDVYDRNAYGPIFWEEISRKSEDEANIVIGTEIELKP